MHARDHNGYTIPVLIIHQFHPHLAPVVMTLNRQASGDQTHQTKQMREHSTFWEGKVNLFDLRARLRLLPYRQMMNLVKSSKKKYSLHFARHQDLLNF